MKEWIGYYKDILTDKQSNDIMSIKDGWKSSTFSNHYKTKKDSSDRVVMDELYISENMSYYKDLFEAVKKTCNLYKDKVTYGKWFNPMKSTNFRVNRYGKGGFMSEHCDYIHHSHQQQWGYPCGSVLFFLNDDYEGGEFIISDIIYKPKKNSAIIFPANFMFPHSVNKVEKRIRYSIITWLM